MHLKLLCLALACVAACTAENPAFLTMTAAAETGGVGSTGAASVGSSSVGSSTGAGTISTSAGGSTADPTTQTATSVEPTSGTSAGTSASGTSGASGTTFVDMSTSLPVDTTGTLDIPGADTTGEGSSTGVMMDACALELAPHLPGPLVAARDALNPMNQLSEAQCLQMEGKELAGRLFIYEDGFSVKQDVGCTGTPIPQSIRFQMPWMLNNMVVAGNSSCVIVQFTAHDGYNPCMISSVNVTKMSVPIITGRFGNGEGADLGGGFLVSLKPKGLCTCTDCCGNYPDPDTYFIQAGPTQIFQGTPPVNVFPQNVNHWFVNMRSDIHPECKMNLDVPSWLHVDWIIARAL